MLRMVKNFLREEDGMGTVEIVLIIIVLIALVALFKSTITDVVNTALTKIKNNAGKI